MGRYTVDEVEVEENGEMFHHWKRQGGRRFSGGNSDEPKRSPIRRKNKRPLEAEMKPKIKRSNKKILCKLKYKWREQPDMGSTLSDRNASP
jgi:hypothetical protein